MVGILKRARQRKVIAWEGSDGERIDKDMLYQGRDEDVKIRLLLKPVKPPLKIDNKDNTQRKEDAPWSDTEHLPHSNKNDHTPESSSLTADKGRDHFSSDLAADIDACSDEIDRMSINNTLANSNKVN